MKSAVKAAAYALVVEQADQQRKFVHLGSGLLTIGRTPESQVVLDDEKASRVHAGIAWTGEGYLIRDLGSKNGTCLNGKSVTTAQLNSGDVIQIGRTKLRIVAAEDASALDALGRALVLSPERDRGPGSVHESELDKLGDFASTLACATGDLRLLEEAAGALLDARRVTIVLADEASRSEWSPVARGIDENIDRVMDLAVETEEPCLPSGESESVCLGSNEYMLLVALRVRELHLGVVVFERELGDRPFDPSDRQIASIAGHHLTLYLRAGFENR